MQPFLTLSSMFSLSQDYTQILYIGLRREVKFEYFWLGFVVHGHNFPNTTCMISLITDESIADTNIPKSSASVFTPLLSNVGKSPSLSTRATADMIIRLPSRLG